VPYPPDPDGNVPGWYEPSATFGEARVQFAGRVAKLAVVRLKDGWRATVTVPAYDSTKRPAVQLRAEGFTTRGSAKDWCGSAAWFAHENAFS